jgi:hypothetical protein
MSTAAAVQVIGFGPAAMGIAVAADRAGVLDELLDAGLIFLERSPDRWSAARRRFSWRILSNSSGRDFVASIARDGALGGVLLSSPGGRIVAAGDGPVWLPDVSDLLHELGDRIEAACARRGGGGVRYGAEAARVVVETDGSFTTYDAAGAALSTSRSLVVAAGAEERLSALRTVVPPQATVVESGRVLAGDLGPVTSAVRDAAAVVIVGSAHSAFAVADLILRSLGGSVRAGQIRVMYRGEIALHFRSLAEAHAHGVIPAHHQICPERGEVNRFNGLRGRARDLYLRVCDGRERRVSLVAAAAGAASAAPPGALFVAATGYVTRRLPFARRDRGPIALAGDDARSVDDACRLLTANGEALPGAFGIGLGHPRTDSGLHRRAAINCFHGADAAAIVSAALARAAHSPRESHRTTPLRASADAASSTGGEA